MNAIEVLMKRDSLSREEATQLVQDTVEYILHEMAFGQGNEDPADIWMNETGLEPDYLVEVL